MNREEALKILNLGSSPGAGELEQTYQRLVRRYPPEFHPEKFRAIDEAYRFLTSVSFRIESLLTPQATKPLDRKAYSFTLSPPASSIEPALAEIEKEWKKAFLWGSLKASHVEE